MPGLLGCHCEPRGSLLKKVFTSSLRFFCLKQAHRQDVLKASSVTACRIVKLRNVRTQLCHRKRY
eukprot:4790042-Amphidinium_carterae.1